MKHATLEGTVVQQISIAMQVGQGLRAVLAAERPSTDCGSTRTRSSWPTARDVVGIPLGRDDRSRVSGLLRATTMDGERLEALRSQRFSDREIADVVGFIALDRAYRHVHRFAGTLIDPGVMLPSTQNRPAWRQAPGRYDQGVTPPVPVLTPAQHVLRLAGLIVVLAGLFGMHGLSNQSGGLSGGPSGVHGAAAMSMDPSASTALMAASTGSMDDGLDLAPIPTVIMAEVGLLLGDQAQGLLDVAGGSGHGTDSGGMAMGAMCVAILGAALLVLLLLLQQARVVPVMWTLPRPARVVVARARDPDPPSLIKLSIQRC